MAKKALVTIVGKQKYDNDNDKIEITTVGSFEETENAFVIRYNEEQEPPHNPIRTTLTIDKNEQRVEMMKTGAYGSLLIIERSKRNLCNYGTEYGNLLMGIFGRNIETACSEEDGTISFSYDIDVNGALTSQNEVTVTYKINQ